MGLASIAMVGRWQGGGGSVSRTGLAKEGSELGKKRREKKKKNAGWVQRKSPRSTKEMILGHVERREQCADKGCIARPSSDSRKKEIELKSAVSGLVQSTGLRSSGKQNMRLQMRRERKRCEKWKRTGRTRVMTQLNVFVYAHPLSHRQPTGFVGDRVALY